VNGEPFNYTNWEAGEPDNASGGQDRIKMRLPSGEWQDIGKDLFVDGYLVEYE